MKEGQALAPVVGGYPGVVHAPAPVRFIVVAQRPGVLHGVIVVVPRDCGEGLEISTAMLRPIGNDEALLGAQGRLLLGM